MNVFLKAVAAATLSMADYFVGEWRKVGAAEAFLAAHREAFLAGRFEDFVVPFEPTEKSQVQYNAAANALRRLTLGYVKGSRSANPVTVEGRYPEFMVKPLSPNVPVQYTATVNVLDKNGKKIVKNGKVQTKQVQRYAKSGILLTLAAATVAAGIDAEKETATS